MKGFLSRQIKSLELNICELSIVSDVGVDNVVICVLEVIIVKESFAYVALVTGDSVIIVDSDVVSFF